MVQSRMLRNVSLPHFKHFNVNLPIAIKENWVSFAKYIFLKILLNVLYVTFNKIIKLLRIVDYNRRKKVPEDILKCLDVSRPAGPVTRKMECATAAAQLITEIEQDLEFVSANQNMRGLGHIS